MNIKTNLLEDSVIPVDSSLREHFDFFDSTKKQKHTSK